MSYTEEQYAAAHKAVVEKFPSYTIYGWDDLYPIQRGKYRTFANALAAESAGTPIAAEDVREGDRVRGVREDGRGNTHTVEGAVLPSDRPLYPMMIADSYIDVFDNLYLLHRPAAQLPTEPPAVIKATEVRGQKGEWWMTLDAFGKWNSAELINTFLDHNPKHITAWKPADFVVREVER